MDLHTALRPPAFQCIAWHPPRSTPRPYTASTASGRRCRLEENRALNRSSAQGTDPLRGPCGPRRRRSVPFAAPKAAAAPYSVAAPAAPAAPAYWPRGAKAAPTRSTLPALPMMPTLEAARVRGRHTPQRTSSRGPPSRASQPCTGPVCCSEASHWVQQKAKATRRRCYMK